MMMSRRPRVLVVDDQPRNVEVIGEYLADRYEVQCAFSGPEALALAVEAPPDLILLDLMMPEMDGYRVCEKLKRDPVTRDVPVIFVTARGDPDTETRALETGGVDFINKPVNGPVLRARIATHIRLKQHADELRTLATVDPLTGLANRRSLSERLESEWRRAMRRRSLLALLMIDIDFFKHYNDQYGHPSGDECLRQVAGAIAGAVSRAGELAARYGGEEFVVLLADAAPGEAILAARRIFRRIRSLDLPHAASTVSTRVTVSIGVAEMWPGHGTDPVTGPTPAAIQTAAGRLLAAADRALYAAKQEGRNRIVDVADLTHRDNGGPDQATG